MATRQAVKEGSRVGREDVALLRQFGSEASGPTAHAHAVLSVAQIRGTVTCLRSGVEVCSCTSSVRSVLSLTRY
jgi:hypothetical protein